MNGHYLKIREYFKEFIRYDILHGVTLDMVISNLSNGIFNLSFLINLKKPFKLLEPKLMSDILNILDNILNDDELKNINVRMISESGKEYIFYKNDLDDDWYTISDGEEKKLLIM